MSYMRSSSSTYKQSGIALVEFTIVLPLLLLMLLGFSELGRAFYQYTELTKHTRDAARYLSAAKRGDDYNFTLFTESTKNLVVYGTEVAGSDPLLPGLTHDDVSVTLPDASHVRVQVSYNYQPMIGAILPGFGFGSDINLNFTLVSTTDMRIL